MPVITCSVCQTVTVDTTVHWNLDIHGVEESEVAYLEEIHVFNKRGGVLTARLERDGSETAALCLNFPPMESITKILNRLNGVGYRVVGSTSVSTPDSRSCIVWTLEK